MRRHPRLQRLFGRKEPAPQEDQAAASSEGTESAETQEAASPPPEVSGPPPAPPPEPASRSEATDPSRAALLAAVPLPKTRQPLWPSPPPASRPQEAPLAVDQEGQAQGKAPTGQATAAPAPPLEKRFQRVAESILDNERLTADLDDAAASELLDWGLACARPIVQDTFEILDDEQADEAMYARLRATRGMMRAVNVWVTQQLEGDAEGSETALKRVFKQAEVAYGAALAPGDEERTRFAAAQSEFTDSPPLMIAHLRHLIEAFIEA